MKLKSILQYGFTLLLAGGLLYLAFNQLTEVDGENEFELLYQVWDKADKGYLWGMAFLALLSHILRAYRWKMLLDAVHTPITALNSFLSLMVGYLLNLVLPRIGEVSRCFNLYKLERTPVDISLGTVITERILDVIFLFLLFLFSTYLEWDKLAYFTIPWQAIVNTTGLILGVVILGVLVAGGLIYLLRGNKKAKKIIASLRMGLMSIFRVKNILLFVIISIFIWILYFFMTYCIMRAFPETHNLGFSAVILLLTAGSIAISIPLPGGVGSYHTLVSLVLFMLYDISQTAAVSVVFIFHAWQTAVILVPGIVAFILSYQLIQWKKYPKN